MMDQLSIATFIRLRPALAGTGVKGQTQMNTSALAGREEGSILYGIETTVLLDKSERDSLKLEIPEDADPGLVHNNTDGILAYEFDHVFDVDTSQEQIFDYICKRRINDVMKGINCTIFAYGQTGSGKTYSISGGDTFQARGMIPRTIAYFFEEISRRTNSSFDGNLVHESRCQISFTEVYNEVVYDLLDRDQRTLPISQRTPVQILETADGIILRNVNIYEVSAEKDALGLFFMGNSARISDSTSMNSVSSRSHAIFTLVIDITQIDTTTQQQQLVSAKINLVDLAGSERMYKMQNNKGQRKEAKSINLSLHHLEKVILALREGASNSNINRTNASMTGAPTHIPYRNSVLTNVLRDSLGGNCKSCFLLTLSLDKLHFEETISTCRFGKRCGEIKISVNANIEVSLLDQLKSQQKKNSHLERKLVSLEQEKLNQQQQIDQMQKELNRGGGGRRGTGENEIRLLSAEEKSVCKLSVQKLLSIAKSSLNIKQTATISLGEVSEGDKKRCDELQGESLQIFQKELIENYDVSMLKELSIALGQLVQNIFIDREMLSFKDKLRLQKTRELNSNVGGDVGGDDNENISEIEALRSEIDQLRSQSQHLGGNSKGKKSKNPYKDMIDILQRGNYFYKFDRHGMKDLRFVCLTADST